MILQNDIMLRKRSLKFKLNFLTNILNIMLSKYTYNNTNILYFKLQCSDLNINI